MKGERKKTGKGAAPRATLRHGSRKAPARPEAKVPGFPFSFFGPPLHARPKPKPKKQEPKPAPVAKKPGHKPKPAAAHRGPGFPLSLFAGRPKRKQEHKPEHEPEPRHDAKPAPVPAAKPPPPKAVHRPPAQQAKRKREPGTPNRTLVRMYRRFIGAMPSGLVAHFERKMLHAGVGQEQSAVLLGRALFLSFLAGALPLMLYLVIFNPIATPVTMSIAAGLFFGGMIFSLTMHYLKLYFTIANRAVAVEKMLPDFLSLTVSNLRAGMSPYAAFVHAARPEFGPFHDAVKQSMSKMGGKGSISDALVEVSENFDSSILRRTVTLFVKGVRSGGQLVRLLNSSADEVRRIQDLRTELISATRTYAIFLSFIVVAVMPFLLAVSANFVSVFVRLELDTSSISSDMPGGIQMPSFSGKILITTQDMEYVSILTLVVIDFMVSLLIGVVNHGKAIYGVKSFPLLVILSGIAFLIAKAIVGSFLSSLIL